MANTNHKDVMISWLNDAYAMEKGLTEVLERRIKDVKFMPEALEKINEHLNATKRHAKLVKERIEALGGKVSAVKNIFGNMAGIAEGVKGKVGEDKLIRNAISDYSAEHMEIASYSALVTVARELNDQETEAICKDILEDEHDMARWIDAQMPILIKKYLAG